MSLGWGSAPDIRDDEDEEALKARFVELCARYPDRSPQEVGRYVFQDLVDPGFRGEDAGMKWGRDLSIIERINKARLNGGREAEPEVPPKAVILAELLAIARNPRTDAKDAIAAYTKVLEAEGHIIKNVAQTTEDKTQRGPPAIVFNVGVKPAEDEEAA